MLKMSSISAQGVVERASAELSKRINGLGLRSKHHHSSGSSKSGEKTSVMERVTNVLCGGSSSNNSAQSGGGSAPEKPSRISSGSSSGIPSSGKGSSSSKSQSNTPQTIRKISHHHQHHNPSINHHGQSVVHIGGKTIAAAPPPPLILTIEQLLQDERFLNRFFLYFSSFERCTLAQVCQKWRDILYRSPRYWSGLVPVLQCRELRQTSNQDRVKLYNTLIRRSFHAVSLMGATDEDALDLVHSFPLASKHVHSLSLRCSSISDRGLEALLDHLQETGSSDWQLLQKIHTQFGVPNGVGINLMMIMWDGGPFRGYVHQRQSVFCPRNAGSVSS
ncbi:uncharacterized protein LOC129742637 [Uranotaenia lowii]|uniref:uncharacterized protein LOC129742637 n=1 Tax=Uranotaenia lowii TaxID=190385 RepID=UPI0024798A0B|nr:uncharacterized protein LOC129742637 [Uranotaenia lowii]